MAQRFKFLSALLVPALLSGQCAFAGIITYREVQKEADKSMPVYNETSAQISKAEVDNKQIVDGLVGAFTQVQPVKGDTVFAPALTDVVLVSAPAEPEPTQIMTEDGRIIVSLGNGTYREEHWEAPFLEDKGDLEKTVTFSAPSIDSPDRKLIQVEEFSYSDSEWADEVTITQYNQQGDISSISVLKKDPGDPAATPFSYTAFTYHENGTMKSKRVDNLRDGTFTETEWDADGNIMKEHSQTNVGGFIQETMRIFEVVDGNYRLDLEWTKFGGEYVSYSDYVYEDITGRLIGVLGPPN